MVPGWSDSHFLRRIRSSLISTTQLDATTEWLEELEVSHV
jgi:hypothetical protein